ncbi:MAG: FemAB family XrtA/PEP-CTERM system-associated protein [Pseudomonadota bacterium]
MSVKIQPFTDRDSDRWDRYVLASKDATFFHRAGWKSVLESAFGHRTHYLFAEQVGEVVGILPLAQVKSMLFGHTLSSLPFCVYGGIVADSEMIAQALRDAACKLAESLGVDALELRNLAPSNSDWPVKELYYTFKKTIKSDEDTNLKAIPNRQRAMIRKGVAEGLQSEWCSGTDRLYRVYSESVRNLGTPVFNGKYLDVLRSVFKDDCSVLMITQSGSDVAGVMNFHFRGEVLPYYGGSTARSRSIKGVNHFMYWELMRRSCAVGAKVFDFGRSKAGTGPFSFKKNFGFTPQPLPYEYYLVKAPRVPDVNPNNPKYRLMVQTWQRLPLPVANILGPPLARHLG